MIMEDPPRSRSGWAWRYWLMVLSGIALVLVAGVYLASRDSPEKASRSVTEPTEEDDASNARIIDKDQRIDIDTFDQKDSPLWPVIEKFRSAVPQDDSMPTNSKGEE
ncbi:hypothetical protein AB0J28_07645 [Streptosporangium canum]|uniref:hypothetical protein n=1 Tax=Streptosporangium canum TaxID=324952 RepID=UPI0034392064